MINRKEARKSQSTALFEVSCEEMNPKSCNKDKSSLYVREDPYFAIFCWCFPMQ